jgi:RNA polymerase sigma factor (sigma-70 family)
MKRILATTAITSDASDSTRKSTDPQAGPGGPTDIGELVAAALRGERPAWAGLVARYLPYVRAIARGYRLNDADVDDVGQTVCLRLVEHLGRIREPRALPAWIGATARHESLRLATSRTDPVDPLDPSTFDGTVDDVGVDADLLQAEQAQAVRDGLAHLPRTHRDLLVLLTDDQRRNYGEIGELLAMPVGSIGPTRARALARLRTAPAIREYLATDTDGPLRRSA